MQFCRICGEPEPETDFITLSCGCTFCKNTVREWTLAQCEWYYQGDFQIRCPEGEKSHALSEEDIERALTRKQYSLYEKFVLRRTLMRDSVFKTCSASDCDYVGWVNTATRCTLKLQCEKCGNEWAEPSMRPLYNKVFEFCTGNGEFFSELWKELWAKFCPKCACPIERNGGCCHMTCKNCEYEFCWYCLQRYRTHKWNYCSTSMGFRYGLLVLMLIFLATKIVCSSQLVRELLFNLVGNSLLISLFALMVWLVVLNLSLIVTLSTEGYSQNHCECLAVVCVSVLNSLWVLGLCYWPWIFNVTIRPVILVVPPSLFSIGTYACLYFTS